MNNRRAVFKARLSVFFDAKSDLSPFSTFFTARRALRRRLSTFFTALRARRRLGAYRIGAATARSAPPRGTTPRLGIFPYIIMKG